VVDRRAAGTADGGTVLDQRPDGGEAPAPVKRRWPTRRLALGLSPTPSPGLALLLLGMALGPQALGVLSTGVLASLNPAVSAALAALGVLVGLHINVRQPRDGRLIAAATVESVTTIVLVGGGVVLFYGFGPSPGPVPWLLALVLGICAVPSSTAVAIAEEPHEAVAARMGDYRDVLPIVLGVLAVAWARPAEPAALAWLILQGGLIAIVIALATWLLMTQTSSESEQRVFTIGALLLLGGAAAHLEMSALFVGLLAGACWNASGKTGREHIVRDMRYLQHPLLLLLLIFAGARLELPVSPAALIGGYIVLRMAGKVVGGWLAARTAHELPRHLGWSLSAPGVVAIAIALDVHQAQGGGDASVRQFAIVIAGTLGSEVLSWVVSRRERAA
jgi:hypothetical protein